MKRIGTRLADDTDKPLIYPVNYFILTASFQQAKRLKLKVNLDEWKRGLTLICFMMQPAVHVIMSRKFSCKNGYFVAGTERGR